MTTTLVDLDPNDVLVNGNVRSKLGDISGLVASIKQRGVLVPVIVRPGPAGGYVLVAGQRRRAAAMKAGARLPAIVHDGLDDDQALLEAGLLENLAREDLGAADEARAFEQLAAFGLDVDAMAAVTAVDPDRVRKGLAVAASAPATRTAERFDLTLDQAAAIAEFEDDRDAVKELAVAAKKNPGEFDHLASRLRLTADRRRKAAELRAGLEAKGVPIVKDRPGYRLDGPCRIDEIRGTGAAKKKNALTAAGHAKCPGHAAFVEESTHADPAVVYLCTEPRKHGHKPRWDESEPVRVGEKAPDDREAEAEERRAVRAGNVEWRAAEAVRLEFVRDLLARRTPPKGTLRFAVEEIAGDPENLGRYGNDKTLVDLLRGGEPGATKGGEYAHGRRVLLPQARAAADGRLPLLLLAQIAADREASMDVHTWRPRPTTGGRSPARRWLDFLESCGYVQSDIEKRVK